MRAMITSLLPLFAAAIITAGTACQTTQHEPATAPTAGVSSAQRLRIGTYDPRAIAIAYAPSELQRLHMAALTEQLRESEAAGDAKRAERIKAQGEFEQRRLHLQGFAGASVDNILARVKDRLPEVARAANVSAIVHPDFIATDVERVDVTNELVKLFAPSEKTLRTISDLRKRPPLSAEEVERAEATGGI